MLTSIRLKNFRGFAKLDLSLKPVSVVVGPNSSGKTTVLHAVGVAHRAYAQAIEAAEAHPVVHASGQITVCDGVIVQDHSRLLPIAVQEEIFRNGDVSEGVTTEIDLGFEATDPVRRLVVRLSYMRNKVLKLTIEVDCPSAIDAVASLAAKSKYRGPRLVDALRRDPPVAVLVPAFYGVTLQEEFRPRPVVDEHLQEGQQSRIVRNLIARLSGGDLEELNAFLERTVGARISDRTPAQDSERVHPLIVKFSDVNGALDLSAAGAGVVNLISLFAALKWRQRTSKGTTVFLLDEPEAHLHPRLQGKLGDELASVVRSFANAQFIAATHSIEMINRLGRRDDAVLIALDRASGTSATLGSEAMVVDELSAWADLTPFTSLNFLASRRLLFHEGPSDARILLRAAEVQFRNRPEDLATFKRWTLVPIDGTGNIPGIAALRKVIQPRVFPHLGQGEAVQLVLVLDRDREREPGMRHKPEGKVHSTEVVWSRHSVESLFLDPEVLAQWLAASMPVGRADEPTLRRHIEQALPLVDALPELNDPVVADLAPILVRGGGTLKDRIKEAQAMVRKEPAVLQKGRERARRILERVREALPARDQGYVRASIVDQMETATVERLNHPEMAVPAEVRALLESMVQKS